MERILRLQESARIHPDRPTDDRTEPGETHLAETPDRTKSEAGNDRSPSPRNTGIDNKHLSEIIGVPVSTLEKWKRSIARGELRSFRAYPNFSREWLIGTDGRWRRVQEDFE